MLELNVIVESNNTKDLHSLYDHVTAQVRSLQSIGLNASDYGPLLIPVLMSKLPHELKLLITRQFGKGVWDVKIILESLKSEIETREKLKLTLYRTMKGKPHFLVHLFILRPIQIIRPIKRKAITIGHVNHRIIFCLKTITIGHVNVSIAKNHINQINVLL